MSLSRSSSRFSRNFRRHSTVLESSAVDSRSDVEGEGVMVEGEDRPLFGTVSTESPRGRPTNAIVRSPSTMSRLGSRLLPDSVVRNLLLSGEETAEEGEALRQGAASRHRASVWERRAPSTHNDRFSISGTLRRHIESRTESRRRSIRGPFPLGHSEHQQLQGEPSNSLGLESAITSPQMEDSIQRRPTRVDRMRHSLSFPISNLFGGFQDRPNVRHMPRSPTPHPSHASPPNESERLLLPNDNANPRSDSEDAPHELDAVEPETRNILSSSRITSGMSTIRRIPHGFRSRSRLIRRGEHPPLSQVLQLAAAAIAAQLGGQTATGVNGLRTFGGEAFDGSIQNFVQTLQDAASAQAGEDININASEGDLPPVNFMRVFQFPNDENGVPMPPPQGSDAGRMEFDPSNTGESDRSVTLVLVGVRSMPNTQEASMSDNGQIGPSLDTLLSLPFLPPTTNMNTGGSGALFRRADTRTRTSRRHSLTNFSFPAQYETQRHHRTRTSTTRSASDQLAPSLNPSGFTSASESPPGPHPPPSTPSDIRSGHATPIRRPSSSSGPHTSLLPDLEEDNGHSPDTRPVEPPFAAPRQRRRSDSEFARRPELGSGAARRNGMVEPDRPPIGSGRSWLIYVVGTNVSPDHPAFTMPSLFTDNPTYEDMQMLSTLLGPAKPPVATQEDIHAAGGVYRLARHGDLLVARPVHNTDSTGVIAINKDDRCLICLCDYEIAEEMRQLSACQHGFHRECIDEVSDCLVQARNCVC